MHQKKPIRCALHGTVKQLTSNHAEQKCWADAAHSDFVSRWQEEKDVNDFESGFIVGTRMTSKSWTWTIKTYTIRKTSIYYKHWEYEKVQDAMQHRNIHNTFHYAALTKVSAESFLCCRTFGKSVECDGWWEKEILALLLLQLWVWRWEQLKLSVSSRRSETRLYTSGKLSPRKLLLFITMILS